MSPEYVIFNSGKDMASGVHHYLLRPEALEAMYIMWHVTRREKYRDWAWQMFLAFEKHCKVTHRLQLPAFVARLLTPAVLHCESSFSTVLPICGRLLAGICGSDALPVCPE